MRLTPARRLTLVGIAAVIGITLTPSVSQADDSSTVTVVGTSDVSDSNLMAAVIEPGFEAAYPQYDLKYVPQGTGAAITTAESGAASALLVHAASLENQFVATGYSEEQYGRAIFYGDYVLLGPASDPAGVLTNAPHDIVTAFERIAAAGAAGTANFVSRGGTPGTTVEEHAIWGLSTGVTTCAVGATNGGGLSPSTTSGDCPATIPYPTWYHATGLPQGGNVENADVCAYTGGNCYVLTDRGTFQYLQSINMVNNLKIVTRDDAADARGGDTLLINSFHAYAINPAKFADQPNVNINLDGAEAFLNWVTSPAAQQAVGQFEASGGDPPFLPDAAPTLTASTVPTIVTAGHNVTVTGLLSNEVPGTPPLSAVQVTLDATAKGGSAKAVDTATTDATGHYSLHYKPKAAASYSVSSPAISQIEIPKPTLDPEFGDLLAETSTHAGTAKLGGAITLDQPTERNGKVRVAGALQPAVTGKSASVIVRGAPGGHRLKKLRRLTLKPGVKSYSTVVKLTPGKKWILQVKYVNHGVLVTGVSKSRTLVV